MGGATLAQPPLDRYGYHMPLPWRGELRQRRNTLPHLMASCSRVVASSETNCCAVAGTTMRHTYFRQYHVTPTGPYGLYTRTRGLYLRPWAPPWGAVLRFRMVPSQKGGVLARYHSRLWGYLINPGISLEPWWGYGLRHVTTG